MGAQETRSESDSQNGGRVLFFWCRSGEDVNYILDLIWI